MTRRSASLPTTLEKPTPRVNEGERRPKSQKVSLELYVSGATPKSLRAVANLKKICELYANIQIRVQIIDIYKERTLVKSRQIVAVPTLLRRLPLPHRILIGDLSDQDKVIRTLGLRGRVI